MFKKLVILIASIVYISLLPRNEIGTATAMETNNPCVPLKSKPSPKYKSYNLDSCIKLEFSAYLKTKTGYYYELNNGHVDNEASNCYNDYNQLIIEPQLVIKFNCGNLTLKIEQETRGYIRNSIRLEGNYLLDGKLYSSTESQWLLKGQECIYYESRVEQIGSIGDQSYIFTNDLLIEIHRSNDKRPLNGCSNPKSSVSLWKLIVIGLIIIVLITLLAFYFRLLPCRPKTSRNHY